MPLQIRKLPHSYKVRVYEGAGENRKVIAKRTTRDKAESLVRLHRSLEHGMLLRKRSK